MFVSPERKNWFITNWKENKLFRYGIITSLCVLLISSVFTYYAFSDNSVFASTSASSDTITDSTPTDKQTFSLSAYLRADCSSSNNEAWRRLYIKIPGSSSFASYYSTSCGSGTLTKIFSQGDLGPGQHSYYWHARQHGQTTQSPCFQEPDFCIQPYTYDSYTTTKTFTVSHANSAPSLSISREATAGTANQPMEIYATATDDWSITDVEIDVFNMGVWTDMSSTGGSNYEYTISGGINVYGNTISYSVRAIDTDGITNTKSSSYSVTLDGDAPIASIFAPNYGPNSVFFEIKGSATDAGAGFPNISGTYTSTAYKFDLFSGQSCNYESTVYADEANYLGESNGIHSIEWFVDVSIPYSWERLCVKAYGEDVTGQGDWSGFDYTDIYDSDVPDNFTPAVTGGVIKTGTLTNVTVQGVDPLSGISSVDIQFWRQSIDTMWEEYNKVAASLISGDINGGVWEANIGNSFAINLNVKFRAIITDNGILSGNTLNNVRETSETGWFTVQDGTAPTVPLITSKTIYNEGAGYRVEWEVNDQETQSSVSSTITYSSDTVTPQMRSATAIDSNTFYYVIPSSDFVWLGNLWYDIAGISPGGQSILSEHDVLPDPIKPLFGSVFYPSTSRQGEIINIDIQITDNDQVDYVNLYYCSVACGTELETISTRTLTFTQSSNDFYNFTVNTEVLGTHEFYFEAFDISGNSIEHYTDQFQTKFTLDKIDGYPPEFVGLPVNIYGASLDHSVPLEIHWDITDDSLGGESGINVAATIFYARVKGNSAWLIGDSFGTTLQAKGRITASDLDIIGSTMTIEYMFQIEDNAGNAINSTIYEQIYEESAPPNLNLLEVNENPTPTNVRSGDILNITAEITDFSGIQSVVAERYLGGVLTNIYPLTLVAGDIYSYIGNPIGEVMIGNTIELQIIVTDTLGNSFIYTSNLFTILDGSPPDILYQDSINFDDTPKTFELYFYADDTNTPNSVTITSITYDTTLTSSPQAATVQSTATLALYYFSIPSMYIDWSSTYSYTIVVQSEGGSTQLDSSGTFPDPDKPYVSYYSNPPTSKYQGDSVTVEILATDVVNGDTGSGIDYVQLEVCYSGCSTQFPVEQTKYDYTHDGNNVYEFTLNGMLLDTWEFYAIAVDNSGNSQQTIETKTLTVLDPYAPEFLGTPVSIYGASLDQSVPLTIEWDIQDYRPPTAPGEYSDIDNSYHRFYARVLGSSTWISGSVNSDVLTIRGWITASELGTLATTATVEYMFQIGDNQGNTINSTIEYIAYIESSPPSVSTVSVNSGVVVKNGVSISARTQDFLVIEASVSDGTGVDSVTVEVYDYNNITSLPTYTYALSYVSGSLYRYNSTVVINDIQYGRSYKFILIVTDTLSNSQDHYWYYYHFIDGSPPDILSYESETPQQSPEQHRIFFNAADSQTALTTLEASYQTISSGGWQSATVVFFNGDLYYIDIPASAVDWYTNYNYSIDVTSQGGSTNLLVSDQLFPDIIAPQLSFVNTPNQKIQGTPLTISLNASDLWEGNELSGVESVELVVSGPDLINSSNIIESVYEQTDHTEGIYDITIYIDTDNDYSYYARAFDNSGNERIIDYSNQHPLIIVDGVAPEFETTFNSQFGDPATQIQPLSITIDVADPTYLGITSGLDTSTFEFWARSQSGNGTWWRGTETGGSTYINGMISASTLGVDGITSIIEFYFVVSDNQGNVATSSIFQISYIEADPPDLVDFRINNISVNEDDLGNAPQIKSSTNVAIEGDFVETSGVSSITGETYLFGQTSIPLKTFTMTLETGGTYRHYFPIQVSPSIIGSVIQIKIVASDIHGNTLTYQWFYYEVIDGEVTEFNNPQFLVNDNQELYTIDIDEVGGSGIPLGNINVSWRPSSTSTWLPAAIFKVGTSDTNFSVDLINITSFAEWDFNSAFDIRIEGTDNENNYGFAEFIFLIFDDNQDGYVTYVSIDDPGFYTYYEDFDLLINIADDHSGIDAFNGLSVDGWALIYSGHNIETFMSLEEQSRICTPTEGFGEIGWAEAYRYPCKPGANQGFLIDGQTYGAGGNSLPGTITSLGNGQFSAHFTVPSTLQIDPDSPFSWGSTDAHFKFYVSFTDVAGNVHNVTVDTDSDYNDFFAFDDKEAPDVDFYSSDEPVNGYSNGQLANSSYQIEWDDTLDEYVDVTFWTQTYDPYTSNGSGYLFDWQTTTYRINRSIPFTQNQIDIVTHSFGILPYLSTLKYYVVVTDSNSNSNSTISDMREYTVLRDVIPPQSIQRTILIGPDNSQNVTSQLALWDKGVGFDSAIITYNDVDGAIIKHTINSTDDEAWIYYENGNITRWIIEYLLPRKSYLSTTDVTIELVDASGNIGVAWTETILYEDNIPHYINNEFYGEPSNTKKTQIIARSSTNVEWGSAYLESWDTYVSIDGGSWQSCETVGTWCTYFYSSGNFAGINNTSPTDEIVKLITIPILPYATQVSIRHDTIEFKERSTSIGIAGISYFNFTILDRVAPTIEIVNKNVGDDLLESTIEVSVFDSDSNVNSVFGRYTINSFDWFDVELSYYAGTYTMNIPAFLADTIVEWIIIANDTYANEVEVNGVYSIGYSENDNTISTSLISDTIIGESSAIIIGENSTFVNFQNTYSNPTVFITKHEPTYSNYSGTMNSQYPILLSVNSTGFEVKNILADDNTQGNITLSSIHYAVFEQGSYYIGGMKAEVGVMNINDDINSIYYSDDFESLPNVFTQLQSNSEIDAIHSNIVNYNSSYIDLSLLDEFSANSSRFEIVGYLLIEKSSDLSQSLASNFVSYSGSYSFYNRSLAGNNILIASKMMNSDASWVSVSNATSDLFGLYLESSHNSGILSNTADVVVLSLISGDILASIVPNSDISVEITVDGVDLISITANYTINNIIFTSVILNSTGSNTYLLLLPELLTGESLSVEINAISIHQILTKYMFSIESNY